VAAVPSWCRVVGGAARRAGGARPASGGLVRGRGAVGVLLRRAPAARGGGAPARRLARVAVLGRCRARALA
jgi:hypothetical protein